MPPKLFRYLIIVWSVVCLSGLGIFLFEKYGPGSEVNMTAYLESPLLTVAFWFIVWMIPSAVMMLAARRQRDDDD